MQYESDRKLKLRRAPSNVTNDIIPQLQSKVRTPSRNTDNKTAKESSRKSLSTSRASDSYLTQILKYIPAEIIAVYVMIDGVLKADSTAPIILFWLVFVILLLLTPLYTWRATSIKGLPPNYARVAVSTISFIVWVFALGGPFATIEWYKPIYGSVLLMLFTLGPPLILDK